jgi:hypothetical protein
MRSGLLCPGCVESCAVDKCTMALTKRREKGESLRVDRHRCIEGRCLHQIMSAKTKVNENEDRAQAGNAQSE